MRRAVVLPAPQRAAPTVIVLHGAATTANLTASWSGFAEAAAGHGFAAVFPQGMFTVWNDGRRDGIAKADDVGFLRALVGRLIERGVADPRRIYLAGISNGGMMTLRMLCEHPELFAGAGTVVASMPAAGRRHLPARQADAGRHVQRHRRSGGALPGRQVGLTGNYGEVWSAERTAAFLALGQRLRAPCRARARRQRSRGDQGDAARLGGHAARGSRWCSTASRAVGTRCSAAPTSCR